MAALPPPGGGTAPPGFSGGSERASSKPRGRGPSARALAAWARQVSEVLRETFHLKKEEGGIELVLGASTKAYQFFPPPQHVDEVFESINRCRTARGETRAQSTDATFAHDPHAQQAPEAQAMGELMAKATCEKYKAGDLVIEEGQRPRTLFNLAKGRVSVEIQRVNARAACEEAARARRRPAARRRPRPARVPPRAPPRSAAAAERRARPPRARRRRRRSRRASRS